MSILKNKKRYNIIWFSFASSSLQNLEVFITTEMPTIFLGMGNPIPSYSLFNMMYRLPDSSLLLIITLPLTCGERKGSHLSSAACQEAYNITAR